MPGMPWFGGAAMVWYFELCIMREKAVLRMSRDVCSEDPLVAKGHDEKRSGRTCEVK